MYLNLFFVIFLIRYELRLNYGAWVKYKNRPAELQALFIQDRFQVWF